MATGRANVLPLVIVGLLVIVSLFQDVKCNGIFGYGLYNSTIEQFSLCNGHMWNGSFNLKLNMTTHLNNGHSSLGGTVNARKDITSTLHAQIKYWKWSGKRFESAMTYNMDNLCDYQNISSFLSEKVSLIDAKTCHIKKGFITIEDASLNELVGRFLGDRFFYGRYKSRVTFYTATDKLCCFSAIGHVFDSKYLDSELKKFKVYMSGNPILLPSTVI